MIILGTCWLKIWKLIGACVDDADRFGLLNQIEQLTDQLQVSKGCPSKYHPLEGVIQANENSNQQSVARRYKTRAAMQKATESNSGLSDRM